jgi:hypothetical protein
MILRRLLFIVLLFSIAACSPIKPWVKPYERQKSPMKS